MTNNPMKAIRGAITVDHNDSAEILSATEELLGQVIAQNQLTDENIVSIIFTATEELTSVFPAKAARAMGLESVPLLCCRELTIEGMLPRCIRILAHVWMPDRSPIHVYLRDATTLRADLDLSASNRKL